MQLNASWRIKASKVFKYAMVNRPVGVGTCPKDGLVSTEDRPPRGDPHHDFARNGVAVYNRKLTPKETQQFEMAFMAEGSELVLIARDVAATLRRYAKAYVEMARDPDDREQVVSTVQDRLKNLAYYRPSVGGIGDFTELVLKELR